MAPMRPPSSPRQPPDTVFPCVSGRKMDVGHGRRAGRGRETDGVSAATWPGQGGSVTWLPKVCSALLPALLPLVIAFRCLEPNGHTGPQVTVMGCLTASDHCCGQGMPATGVLHQHHPARALFAGFLIITPHNHFTVSQPANAKEATALIRLLHACVTVAGSLAQL